MGFDEPRPIQLQTIPAALRGRDVLGLAQTGTGKTAAFAIPILERLLEGEKAPGPRALVVAPTRELAIQIDEEFSQLGKFTYLRSTTVFGGVPQGKQVRALKNKPDIVVACPGRLLDLMQQGHVRLNFIETLVLDEADHMFDMGFLPSIRRIVEALPKRRQNLLFSATMPREIRGLADKLLTEPHVVELAHSAPAETIEHALYPVESTRKLALLDHLLKADDFHSAIVFLRTKHRARRLAQQLERMNYKAVALQGNMSQGQRERAMNGFREGRYNVLVATDIAARGIDVAAVSHVVNFDMPGTPDAYTHRIGRTGRAELSGKAYTFVTSEDRDDVRVLERKIGMEIPRRKVEGFEGVSMPSSSLDREPSGRGRGGRGAQGGRSGRPAGRSSEGSAPASEGVARPKKKQATNPTRTRSRGPARVEERASGRPPEPLRRESTAPKSTTPQFGAGLDDAPARSEARRTRTRSRGNALPPAGGGRRRTTSR